MPKTLSNHYNDNLFKTGQFFQVWQKSLTFVSTLANFWKFFVRNTSSALYHFSYFSRIDYFTLSPSTWSMQSNTWFSHTSLKPLFWWVKSKFPWGKLSNEHAAEFLLKMQILWLYSCLNCAGWNRTNDSIRSNFEITDHSMLLTLTKR